MMRKGQLAAHEPIPFMGSSHYNEAMRASPTLGTVYKGSKPMDSLVISDKIRMIANKSMTKRDYQAYTPRLCGYQIAKNKKQ